MPRKPTGLANGRPTDYTADMGREIARRYAQGEAIHVIAQDESMPARGTIREWRDRDRGGFASMLSRARKDRAASKVDEATEHLDAVDLEREGFDVRLASPTVQLAERKAGHCRWQAERLDREAWGDSLKVDGKLDVNVLTAFADLAPLTVDAELVDDNAPELPHVLAPDGADDASE